MNHAPKKTTRIRWLAVSVFLMAGIIFAQPCTAKINMVAIAGDWINMRGGPGQNYPVLWQVDQGYPLKVLKRQGSWLKVVDFEGDLGWVAARLTSRQPHMIVKADIVNVRAKPSTRSPVIAQARKSTLFETLGHQGDWVKVRHRQGLVGWVAKRLLWGW